MIPILIPLRTEKETRRLPYFTMGLIILNLLIWVVTNQIVSPQMAELRALQKEFLRVHYQLLRMEKRLTEEFEKIHPGYFKDHTIFEFRKAFYENLSELDRWRYREWVELYRQSLGIEEQFKATQKASFLYQWGLKPRHWNFLHVLTSMFLHGNFLHVFGNMLFLWIFGCHIEDAWGWWRFLLAYLFSGLSGAGLHTLRFAGSDMPCIGASGAIFGIMGIFGIKYLKTKIKMAYFWWPLFWRPYLGIRSFYAGFLCFYWVAWEIFYATFVSSASGVAHWAHLGGFIFGLGLITTLKLLGLDREEEPVLIQEPSKTMRFQIQPGVSLVLQAKRAIQANPENPKVYLFFARAFLERGQEKNARLLYNLALSQMVKSSDQGIYSLYSELDHLGMIDSLSEKNVYSLAKHLEKQGYPAEAVKVYIRYANRFPQGKARSYVLYRSYLLLRDRLNHPSQAEQVLAILQKDYPGFELKISPSSTNASFSPSGERNAFFTE